MRNNCTSVKFSFYFITDINHAFSVFLAQTQRQVGQTAKPGSLGSSTWHMSQVEELGLSFNNRVFGAVNQLCHNTRKLIKRE